MFVGHLALAFAARTAARDVNVGWLVAGVTMLDLVWPVLVIAGVEHVRIAPGATAFTPFIFESYPWSHSLVMSGVWAAVLVLIARWRAVPRTVWGLLAALVVSHWVLDLVTHAPDMPLWPGPSPRFGLGLWYSIPLTLLVEGLMWTVALVVYIRTRPPHGARARAAFWSLVGVCTVLWLTGPWSPPPPTAEALGWFALIGWLIVPWAALVERRPEQVPA
jgi:hypothetical protein